MSFGFMGIQFGFALQLANTSRIFQIFGGEVENLAIYYIAGPITGLVVQPIIGYFSDRTWHPKWGRRRPFFMAGALLASVALVAMPNAGVLWAAIGVLWIMDTSFNVAMEPFRAFVGDKLPSEQRTMGYATQTFLIGIGAVIASMLPYILTEFGVSNEAGENEIPTTVKYSFYAGAVAILLAVGVTVFSTKEYPPEDLEAFKEEKKNTKLLDVFYDIFGGLLKMPKTMVQLAVVQFFSWFAFYCMWVYATPTVAENVFGTKDVNSDLFQEAGNWVGNCFAVYNGMPLIFAFLLPLVARWTSRKLTHAICLAFGAIGMASVFFVTDKYMLLLSMVGIGIAWTSILSMPYAILVGALPEKRLGYFVGVFNFFIVIPQLIAGLALGPIIKNLFSNDATMTLLLGGICLLLGAFSVAFVTDQDDVVAQT